MEGSAQREATLRDFLYNWHAGDPRALVRSRGSFGYSNRGAYLDPIPAFLSYHVAALSSRRSLNSVNAAIDPFSALLANPSADY